MKILTNCLRSALLTLGIAITQSCSHQPGELPAPVADATEVGIPIAEAHEWYQATYPGAVPAAAAGATASLAATAPVAQLVWQRALTTGTDAQQLVLVPFAGDAALFAHSPVTSLRYLIVARQTTSVLDGKILELVLPRTTQPIDTLGLFASL